MSTYAPTAVAHDGRSDEQSQLYALLTDERRRHALRVVESESLPTDAETLARAVAEREADGDVSAAQVERVHVSLHHVHLPKLAAHGLVEYDPETGVVEASGAPVSLDSGR